MKIEFMFSYFKEIYTEWVRKRQLRRELSERLGQDVTVVDGKISLKLKTPVSVERLHFGCKCNEIKFTVDPSKRKV